MSFINQLMEGNMTNTNNPLANLLIDEDEIRKKADEILSSTLSPYIRIVKSNQEVQLTQDARKLPGHKKVLIALAARLAAKRLNLIKDETMSQKELIESLNEEGVPEGSVKSALNRLRKEKMVSQRGSRYYIGFDKLLKLEQAMKGTGDE